MQNFQFYSPTKVYFGKDSVQHVGQAVRSFGGKHILLHYGSDRVLKNGLMDRVVASLNEQGLTHVMLGGVVPNPRVSLVEQGAALVKAEGIDFILAVGGGSVIDSAKGIAMAAVNDCAIWDIYARKAELKAALPTGNVLTLAAAGSETSNGTVLTNEENWAKVGFGHELLRPTFTIMDPEFQFTLPPYQTASGIVDIMVHTFERYFSHSGANELTDRLAEQVLKVTMRYGALCMEQPDNYEARSELLWAGSLSHNDLTGLGRPGDWAVHDLEHELSAKYDVTHGAGLAAIWASWARYVYKNDVMRFARYGVNVFGLPMDFINPENTALEAIRRTEAYFESIQMPTSITALVGRAISDEDKVDMARRASHGDTSTLGNFQVLNQQMMLDIYRMAD